MLKRENCRGIWAAVPMEWDEDYNFDVDVFKENTRRICEAGADGVYTTGSTGEFYAIDFREFQVMVDAFAEVTEEYNIFTGVGTTALNTREVIRMVEYCGSNNIDSVMPAFPSWIKLRDEECLQFFQEVCRAAGDMGIIHYNISRSKRLLTGKDYREIIQELPDNFLGSKSTRPDFAYYSELRKETPELAHFPAEVSFVPSMMAGGKGIISILFCLNPDLMKHWYNLCLNKEWEKAMEIQMYWNNFHVEVLKPVLEQGYLDPAIDRAQVLIGGFLKGSNRLRKPYLPVPEKIIEKMRRQVENNYPELIWKNI